jgi:hypothetical protein
VRGPLSLPRRRLLGAMAWGAIAMWGGNSRAAPPGEWPYLWLDATYLKQREGGRIVMFRPST